MSISGIADAQTPGLPASPAIYLNQSGFYPKAPKIAVIASNKLQKFSILSINKRVVFTGQTKAAAHPDLSGDSTCIADFTTLQQPGKYMLQITGGERSYPFTISAKIHREVAAAAIKGFYYQRASVALPPTYAGKWNRTAGHPDNIVIIHPSAATDVRPAGTIISSPRGWYDAGDYNKYIVNSGISMGTLLSLYEDFPAYNRSAHLNIPESGDKVPDLLNEIVWNLRWMLTMQDPADGGVYHKLTNAVFDWMIMPDKAVAPRYVVQKGTAATLDFAAVMAQASRIFNNYNRQLPGLADSCMSAAANAWHWAIANPGVAYDQNLMNTKFKPAVVTGDYGDNYFADEFTWAAAELYIT
ncbi:MAG: cellulase, partial [Sphingobacteriales bacterium]